MGEQTGISWCDHTLNLWIGCTKVSEGCKLCYAERDNERYHWTDRWGPQGTRHKTKTIGQLIGWNKQTWWECLGCGWRGSGFSRLDGLCPACLCNDQQTTRQRVFINSLSDLFEDRPELVLWRNEFWEYVEQCPELDFLLLTKRPDNIERMIPDGWIFGGLPSNIWWGISAENQKEFNARIPVLESFGRRSHGLIWVSLEPMLGPIDLEAWLTEIDDGDEDAPSWSRPIDWVVCGGESGPGCRPMEIGWARTVRDQCQEASVPFYMKQLGGFPDRGERLESIPADLRIREWPQS